MAIIALPVYRHRVAPAFDFASRILLVHLQNKIEEGRVELAIGGFTNADRTEALVRNQVDTLICGGISDELLTLIKSRGIVVTWGIAGPINDVIKAYQRRTLNDSEFHMPGRKQKI